MNLQKPEQLIKRLLSPGATMDEICEMIRADQLLSQRVLRLANSTYYSIPGGVSDLRMALYYIGATTLVQLVLTGASIKQ